MDIGLTARAILFYAYLRIQSNKIVSVTELAKILETSKPNISQILKQLKEIRYVEHERYQSIKLTKNGLSRAEIIYYRILIIESFLFKTLAMPFFKCRSEAFSWELGIHESTVESIALKHPIQMSLTGDNIPLSKINTTKQPIFKACKHIENGSYFTIAAYKNLDEIDPIFLTELSTLYLEKATIIGLDDETMTYALLCNEKKSTLPKNIIDRMICLVEN